MKKFSSYLTENVITVTYGNVFTLRLENHMTAILECMDLMRN
jgi:hypothetical protein